MLSRLFLILTLFCLSLVAHGAIQPIEKDFTFVGQSKLKVFAWDIYQSELYTLDGKYTPDMQEYVLKIIYLRDIKSESLIKQTVKQWRKLGIDESAYRDYPEQLKAIWPDVTKGDALSMHVTPQATYFYFNNQLSGSIDTTDFGPLFGSIWLSPKTSQPELRKQLIGEG